jgi:hypothetical protein
MATGGSDSSGRQPTRGATASSLSLPTPVTSGDPLGALPPGPSTASESAADKKPAAVTITTPFIGEAPQLDGNQRLAAPSSPKTKMENDLEALEATK